VEAPGVVEGDEPATSEEGAVTILAVDDEPIMGASYERTMAMLGYTVLLADIGEEALSIYREKEAQISLVVLDLVVPVMDREETFRRLRELDPGARILIASGHALDKEAVHRLSLGACSFIQKPFTMEHLGHKIERAMQVPLPLPRRVGQEPQDQLRAEEPVVLPLRGAWVAAPVVGEVPPDAPGDQRGADEVLHPGGRASTVDRR